MSKFDFIIVGQGLAGTCLSYELSKRGQRVLVIDDDHKEAASMVAAGMWNPIVFRRMSKSWKADVLLPILRDFYHELSDLLGIALIEELPIDKLFPSQEAANQFDEKSDLPGFSMYLKASPDEPPLNALDAPHGRGRIEGGGYLRLPDLLKRYREKLSAENRLLSERFDPEKLVFGEDGTVDYSGNMANNLIFCTGFQNASIPWFSDLPLRSTKGELLELHSKDLSYNGIVNNGKFLLPLGDGLFKLGATYEWGALDTSITSEARMELLSKAEPLIQGDFEVRSQAAGIRPTVKDRRPLVGRHPDHKALAIFNGLGTKGVMIAPWLTIHFADYLLKNTALDPEVDIQRFSEKAGN